MDVGARQLSCESCGQVFDGVDVAAQKRWAPPPPPPPVELFGVPAAIDVLQPGDGTIEFRIAHLQRRKHGPEALGWFLWVVCFGVGTLAAVRVDRLPIALLCVVLAWPGLSGLIHIARRARTFTRLRWDRITGALTAQTTGGPEIASRYVEGTTLELRPTAEGIELVALGNGAGEREKRLAIDVPLNATEWVLHAMRGMRGGAQASGGASGASSGSGRSSTPSRTSDRAAPTR